MTFDQAGTSTQTGTSIQTIYDDTSYTQPTGEGNTMLVICFTASNVSTMSNVQWDGVAMTLAESGTFGGDDKCYMYYVLNPSVGNKTFHFVDGVPNQNYEITFASYSKVLQSGQPDGINTVHSTNSITTVVGTKQDWVLIYGSLGSPTASTNVTQRAAANGVFFGDSNGGVPAGNYTQTLGGNPNQIITAAFQPDALVFPNNMFLVF